MGNINCQRSSAGGSCGWGEEMYTCRRLYDSGDIRTFDACHTSTRAVGLQIVLPICLLLLVTFLIYLLIRFRKLRAMRRQQLLLEYSAAIAVEHGRYAAGTPNYTFNDDILPHIWPGCCCLRGFCLTERMDLKIVFCIGFLLFVLAAIFLPMGLFTLDIGQTDYPFVDSAHLSTAAVFCFAFGIGICIVACCIQRVPERRAERLAKIQALMAIHVDAVTMSPMQSLQMQQYHQILPGQVQQMQWVHGQPAAAAGVVLPYAQQSHPFASPPIGYAPPTERAVLPTMQ